MSNYGVISGPYFPVLSLTTGKYGPEITPYLDTSGSEVFSERYRDLYLKNGRSQPPLFIFVLSTKNNEIV